MNPKIWSLLSSFLDQSIAAVLDEYMCCENVNFPSSGQS